MLITSSLLFGKKQNKTKQKYLQPIGPCELTKLVG